MHPAAGDIGGSGYRRAAAAWTTARLNQLTSKPATGAITTSTSLLPRTCAHTRVAIAAILLDLAENPALARTPVNITGT